MRWAFCDLCGLSPGSSVAKSRAATISFIMRVQRILLSNAKGGCGKTTLATNIAAWYAANGQQIRLFDYDTQGSAMHWSKRRSPEYPLIDAVDAARRPGNNMTRSWQMRVPPQTDRVIIDTPAGIDGPELASMLQENDYLIIPVLPSPIDIQATAYFIRDILLIGKARKKQIHIGVVANRVRKNTLMYHALKRFLFTLKLPFITSFRDTQHYNKAIEKGLGILDNKSAVTRIDHEQWAPLLRWLDAPEKTAEAEVTPLFGEKAC